MQLCEYGCGQEAKYQFKNEKWCCSKSHNSCPHMKQINSLKGGKHRGIKNSQETKEKKMLLQKLHNRKGFTLIEIVIVFFIILILAAIVLPVFVGMDFNVNTKITISEPSIESKKEVVAEPSKPSLRQNEISKPKGGMKKL